VRVEFSFLHDEETLKSALQDLLECSGQLLKKYFSSKELTRAVKARESISVPLDFVNHLRINPEFSGPLPKILKDTKDYLVVHKPPFLHCHPLCYSDKDTILNFLVKENKSDVLKVNPENYDRGLLFRLDYETSGVLVLAKNQKLLERLRRDFTQMKSKYYWAIVDGDFDREGRHAHYFRATGVKGHKQVVTDSQKPDSTEGVLKVKKVLGKEGKSLLLVKLETGLRHQIRAQLSHLGFPILGDELYGGMKDQRVYLHALKYEWEAEAEAEDSEAELFDRFFDLNSALQMSHDMFGSF
jgi:23S rRNA pseudouridine1911/1915/1917 synthase